MKTKMRAFTLICLTCGNEYDGWYNNQTCYKCGETEKIRWILNKGFEKHIPNPHEAKVENMKIIIKWRIDETT